MLRLYLYFIGVWFCLPSLSAQVRWDANVSIANIWKHSEEILFPTDVLSYAIDLRATMQSPETMEGLSHLQDVSIYYGGSVRYMGHEYLGYASSIYAGVEKRLLAFENFNITIGAHTGIAYVSQSYRADNRNVAIGSALNSTSEFSLKTYYIPSESLRLKLGMDFTHYSNGALQLPNLGLNYYNISFGLSQTIEYSERSSDEFRSKFRFSAGIRAASAEWLHPYQSKYPIVQFNAACLIQKRKKVTWRLGAALERNYVIYNQALMNDRYASADEARNDLNRWVAFIGRDIHFRNYALYLQSGYHLRALLLAPPSRMVNTLGVKRYFMIDRAFSFSLGAYLNAHATVAEYIGIGLEVILF